MPCLVVTPLSRLTETIETHGARDVLTLMMADNGVPDLTALKLNRHAVVGFSDITEPRDGYVLPNEAHVSAVLAFLHDWDRQNPLVIHCFAGISRSTAAAYIAACALAPQRDEALIAEDLRQRSPSATPNPRLIAVADALLARQGRMVAAIRAIGRGRDAFEGEVFGLEV